MGICQLEGDLFLGSEELLGKYQYYQENKSIEYSILVIFLDFLRM